MSTQTALAPLRLPVQPVCGVADLDRWEATIDQLDAALRDTATARATLDRLAVQMDRAEARHLLAVEGRNEAERKARLTLTLADDPAYERLREEREEARDHLALADRAVQVLRERCRLLRAALAIAAG